MKHFTTICAATILFIASASYADRDVTLPFEETFNTQEWLGDLALTECGGTATHVTQQCYDAGCVKVTPPTSACTGGGINGGQTGIGWINYPGTSRVHIQFLVYFGSSFADSVADGGGGLINKFLLQDAPSRSGILGLNATDTAGRYVAFAPLSEDEVYVFSSPPSRGWIEDSTFRISATQNSEQWLAVEYWIDTSTRETGLYVWNRDGLQQEISGVSAPSSISQRGFYISYYNSYGRADNNNYYLMDNIRVSTQYIGPPAGFLGTGTPVETPDETPVETPANFRPGPTG